MHIYDVEFTDTFSGEANYCWVRRGKVEIGDWGCFKGDGNFRVEPKGYTATLMRRAKASVGLTGVRGVKTEYGDIIEFRPHRSCTIMFVTFREDV